MNTITFQVNKKLDIICDNGAIAKSIIQEVNESFFYISIPMSGGIYYPLNQGDIIEAYYSDEKKNIYKFKSHVVGRKHENIPLIAISMPTEFYKVQRRNYVRINYVTEISYLVLKNYDIKAKKNVLLEEFTKGYSVDLSGGGIKVKIAEKLELNDILMVCLPIEHNQHLVKCKVKRIEKNTSNNAHVYGLSFQDLDNTIREAIIGFIFKYMRKNIRSK
ncbi:c-di-GMP-binding flagellar brake protein YcgR [Clostridium punense]|uniref:C-di-GMP-binding flagellar brake protein YcgR n=1 Tax=Clostridium punense TaxID=1054297 RepID=A0ABS4K1Y6_9CLOT|nr:MULTISPECIES: flagellar brake domain-containing protein [Clostridium]EQB87785.1 hypothetical protein M918_07425 [Clostridium sp. BL8]MBP2021787.1 c-di-GMP-binding flagellar brake protein YcgR [Clostridium punense]